MALVHGRKFVTLQPQSHLDLQGGVHLRQQLAASGSEPSNVWILDMARVEFINSAGLVALISTLNAATSNDCRLILCNVHPSIRLVFEITQLDQAFEVVDSVAEITEAGLPISEPKPVKPERVAA